MTEHSKINCGSQPISSNTTEPNNTANMPSLDLVVWVVIKNELISVDLSFTISTYYVELAWLSGSIMDCNTTVRDSIPGRNGVFSEPHVHRKGQ